MSTGKYKLSNYYAANASRSKLSSAQEWMSRCRLVGHAHAKTQQICSFSPFTASVDEFWRYARNNCVVRSEVPSAFTSRIQVFWVVTLRSGATNIDVSEEYTSFILKGDAWHSSTVLNAVHAFQAVREYNNTADQCPKTWHVSRCAASCQHSDTIWDVLYDSGLGSSVWYQPVTRNTCS